MVGVSAPAAAFAVRGRGTWTSRDFYPALSRLHLGAIGTVLATLVLADAFIGGWWGDPVSFTANPLPLVFWVDFWVGVGIISALVANVWDFISPVNWAGRALDRALARRDFAVRAYPDWLGVWPSVVLLLVFSWMELVWEKGDRPRDLLVVLVVYIVGQLGGMALFGAETWIGRAELFTVLARTFGRFAPVEYFVRTEEGEVIGDPDAWLAADREERGVRLRPYGAGIRREPPLLPGGGAFVVATLATVVFDGYHSSKTYATLIDRIFPGEQAGSESVGTLAMIVIVGGFLLAFIAVSALVSVFEEGSVSRTAERYAPTLIPIAAVYFAAHYFLYWGYLGQLTPGTLADPFERDWVPDYGPWQPLSGATVWWIQVVLIVFGHIVAVVEAHRVSLTVQRRSRDALVAQIPFVILMVAYTFSGLWVLGQSLREVS
ncbi:MAG TPA: hypothetical protein VFU10_05050 [Gaiellaceae bacterium]|nr:hypothetical protein [Gaiellaceae bacterium]